MNRFNKTLFYGQLLKLADIYSNLLDILYDSDESFKQLYFSEKKETLLYLTKVTNHPLYEMVTKLINKHLKEKHNLKSNVAQNIQNIDLK